MKKESLIGHITEALAIFGEHSYIPADAVLRNFFLERKYLGAKDRRDIAIPYYSIVKHYLRLEAKHIDAWEKQEIHPVLIVAAYYLTYENEKPEEMKRIIRVMENDLGGDFPIEVFEKMADPIREEERLAKLDTDERLSVFYSIPLWFVKAIGREYGEAETEQILSSLNEEANTVIRANTLVSSTKELEAIFEASGIKTTPSKISPDALVLQKRINAMEYPSFRKGAFEIQDEASQLVAPMAHIESPKPRILDACAGAGGKTLHFASLIKNRGEIFATDVDSRKLDEAKRRIKRSSAQNVRIVYPEDRTKYLGKDKREWFDAVLLDVPCTGTGTLRRNPSIKWNLTEDMLTALVEKQHTIVEENIGFVKPGGVLLYATCSLLQEESEDQVRKILAEHPEFALEEEMRTRVDKDGCDGFYAARLRKKTT